MNTMAPEICGGCDTKLPKTGDHAICSACSRGLHFDSCSIKKQTWKSLGASGQATWVCASCRKNKKGSSVTVESDEEELTATNTDTDLEVSSLAVQKAILFKVNALMDMKGKLDSIENSMKFLAEKYDDLLAEVSGLRTENRELKAEMEALKARDNSSKNTITELQASVVELDQYGRRVNLEIHGLAMSDRNEDMEAVLEQVAQKIRVEYRPTDIHQVHRLQPRRDGKPPTVIVQFHSKTVDMDMSEALSCSGGNLIIPTTGSRLVAKLDDEGGGTAPPALPPRPPPRPRSTVDPSSHIDAHLKRTRVKKYVFLCSVCGGLASLLGTLFLAVYLILRTYTSSLDYFETIPTYIPAAMLMVTGLAVMCLARRRNRYIFLIKLCGLCCLMCVGTCVLVTVTTTVVHMSRLQSLRECVYTLKTQTCTCYSVLLESASERTDEGSRYVFNATPDCEAIHGALYSCLRALFGLSVIGILVCIFCCMLVYQLLSHERKKMYWEQLELRCRYLYGQASNPARNTSLAQTPTQHCACCQQFRYQQDILTWEPSDNRFWSGGQVGNLYSPNPVGEDCVPAPLPEPSSSGWSWRRLPWSRQAPSALPPPSTTSHRSSNGYHQPLNCSSPDSQYGFSSEPGRVATVSSGTASYTVIDPVVPSPSPGCHVYHWGPPPPYSDPNSPSRPVLCPPGPHHHHCQRNYVNTGADGETTFTDNESCRVLQLRIPSRRPDLPLSSSSSSSIKSNTVQNATDDCGRHQRTCQRPEPKPTQRAEEGNWHDCGVSPRIKYLHNKLQNSSVNPSRKRTQELSESEVYFADVSSCNVSVRNDSMSIYGEALDNKHGERMLTVSVESQEVRKGESFKKQLRPPTVVEEKSPCRQMVRSSQTSHEVSRSDNIISPNEMCSFQRVPPAVDCPYSGLPLDGSEEDDPELVNFSQRQSSVKGRPPHYRGDNSNKVKNEPEQEISEPVNKGQNEFPSPMSISSPSTVGKGNGGFYTEIVNSDNGSSDSVWSGYSPDLLAPDAQYEVIPEHRMVTSEDLNGNPNDTSGNRGRLKLYLLSKKRQYPQVISENWSVNSSVCSENQEFSERQKCSGNNINSQKGADRSKDLPHKTPRSNERCLADILNSPKANYKNTRHDQISNNHPIQNFSERRRNEFLPLCDHGPPGSNVGGLYYTISENDNICCDRTYHESYDHECREKTEPLNSPKMSDHEVLTSAPKVMERVKLSNSNFVNSLEPSEDSECFHTDSSCRCYSISDLPDAELTQVRPVDV